MIKILFEHDLALLLLAYAMAVGAVYAAFHLIEGWRTTRRLLWLLWGTASLGIGVWSMHFIATAARHAVVYDVYTALGALLVSLAASFISLFVIGLSNHSWGYIWLCSFVLGTGIAIMHYVGMNSTHGLSVVHDPWMVALTHVTGWLSAFVLFSLSYRWKRWIRRPVSKTVFSFVLGIGLLGLHLIGMLGTTYSGHGSHTSNMPSPQYWWIGGTLFFVTLFILFLAVACVYIDRQLAASEQRYRPLFEDNPDLILLINSRGMIVHANASATRILGYRTEEYKMKHIHELMAPGEAGKADMLLRKVLCEGGFRQEEWQLVNKEGRLVSLRLKATPRVVGHDVQGIYIIGQDLSDSAQVIAHLVHQHQLETQYQELKFQTVVDSVLDAVIVTDLNMSVVVWNKGAERIFGYSGEEVLGKPIDYIIPAHFLSRHRRGVQNFRQGGPHVVIGKLVELEGRRKNGDIFPLELSLNSWTADTQSFFSAVIRDISERKQAEEALLKSEEMYRCLIESFPEAILIAQGTRWVYVNKNGVKLLGGKKPEHITSLSVFESVHPDFHPNVRKRIQLTEKQGKDTERMEEKWIRLNGDSFHAQVSAIPAVFNNEMAHIVMVRDTTELQKAREIYERSEKLSVAGELAAGIAHEIRNPLTAIKGFLQLTKKDFNPGYYEIIQSELCRIELIISEMLMVAKPQKTAYVSRKLQSLVMHVAALMESQAHLNGIAFEIDLPADDIWVRCDENQLKQVFINMIKNAIEAMEPGGTVTLEVRREHQTAVQIRISDQGIGIPEEKLSNLGQPFYTTKDKGTGLGLMISYNIIRNHQGHVSVQSVPGQGTAFTVTLPLAETEENGLSAPSLS